MQYESALESHSGPLLPDTSVVINLNATGYAERLLDALPHAVLIAEQVLQELEEGRERKHNDADVLLSLQARGAIGVVSLGPAAERLFSRLVDGSAASTLDDGEAATIAAAQEHKGLALIDERKALRICGTFLPSLATGCTLDLLRDRRVQHHVSQKDLADAVFNATLKARMRVPHHHARWVVSLIGLERAKQCSSLRRALRGLNAAAVPSTRSIRERAKATAS